LKQVPRFEQSSRGKQINPSSPPLIKADAPSVREREVAGSAAPSAAPIFHRTRPRLGADKVQHNFFVPARPFPTSIINTAL